MPSSTSTHWPVSKVRTTFIDYFAAKPGAGADGHRFVPSSPCVPHDDPTLLFTNAGMNQFKPLFLGRGGEPGTPLHNLRRAVNSQKCIRAGGKHNDLEDVGKDTYHHTFFEMLGNWSFGDYFKKEAIDWSFELLTKVYGLPTDRLYATYFQGEPSANLAPDDEARQLWLKHLPEEQVLPGNMKDNFWEMGETGPCGPCSEIHFDRRPDDERLRSPGAAEVNTSNPDVIEIWNNVFIQFNREEGGTLKPLPAKHVDTGMGLERLTSILQGKRSNYDTDAFMPIFAALERITGARAYTGRLGTADAGQIDTAYRVIADHIRTLTFAITDGAVPSNEGRGYVLRRILRRAVRFGKQKLGAKTGFLSQLVPTVVEVMGGAFAEVRKDPARVAAIIREEEESFGKTLDRGIRLFDEAAQRGGLSAEDAFKLHDTFGFPVDLTAQMAEERGLRVDVAGFERLMAEAKEKARTGGGGKFAAAGGLAGGLPPDAIARLEVLGVSRTDDSAKFERHLLGAHVKAIWNGQTFDEHALAAGGRDALVGVVLDQTNCYAELGGQEADHGRISVLHESRAASEATGRGGEFKVEHVVHAGPYVLHVGRVLKGELRVGDRVQVAYDGARRQAITANHTATHLLNLALREVLGDGADQKGSLVAGEKLRFDFACPRAVSVEELARAERSVRERIEADLPVFAEPAPLAAAQSIAGLRAVFGEKYPDPVRVVSIGAPASALLAQPNNPAWRTLSIEFCGGVHVQRTREIAAFALVSEEAVAKGVRRIVALTGVPAQAAIAAAEQMGRRLLAAGKLSGDALADEVQECVGELEALELPAVRKHELRASLAALAERVKEHLKAASAAKSAEAVTVARQIAEGALAAGTPVIVNTVEAAGDRKALQAAVNTVQQLCPRAAVMLFSPEPDEGKVSIIAAVPPNLVSAGLSAGEWVRVAAEVCGGKGGGKPDNAQGGGTDLSKLKEAIVQARAFAMKKVM